MYLTKTPVRVSLFGGGTDYPEYFERHPGAVIGLAINKYINIAAIKLTGIQDYRYRLSYSKLELVNRLEDIKHPVVREVLKYCGLEDPLDISVMSDLPSSGSGLGSSSAFTVGFLNLVHAIKGVPMTKIDLARTAIKVEREILRENVGVQDQMHATFGGINRFDFHGDQYQITPVQLTGKQMEALNRSMLLVHTGVARRATDIVEDQIIKTKEKKLDTDLSHLYDLVGDCMGILEGGRDDFLSEIGRMLSESWKIKRALSDTISNPAIDDLHAAIMKAGAYGAKLCGAGGGGFFLVLADEEVIPRIQAAVAPAASIPISMDVAGTRVVL